ncbi:MAG TPA: ferredoxin [Acidobacteria bacterium]|nr:ferredoxin [Acidobacteriota bacterium]
MADPSAKHPENAPGKFYVDENCGGCQVCIGTAPENFQMTDDDDHAYVVKQPANDEELEACQEAMDSCPDEAIGDDGE